MFSYHREVNTNGNKVEAESSPNFDFKKILFLTEVELIHNVVPSLLYSKVTQLHT